MNTPRHGHKFKKHPEYPSLAEVQKSERWSVYQEILAGYSPQTKRVIVHSIAKRKFEESGMDIDALVKQGPHVLAYDCHLAFFTFFSESQDELDAFSDLMKIFSDIGGLLESNASNRHNMIDALKSAGASWEEIAAMLVDSWEEMEQGERETEADRLKQAHKSYRKKYPVQVKHHKRNKHKLDKQDT